MKTIMQVILFTILGYMSSVLTCAVIFERLNINLSLASIVYLFIAPPYCMIRYLMVSHKFIYD